MSGAPTGGPRSEPDRAAGAEPDRAPGGSAGEAAGGRDATHPAAVEAHAAAVALAERQRDFFARAYRTRPALTWLILAGLVAVHVGIVVLTARPGSDGFSWWGAIVGAVPSGALVQLGAVGPTTLARGEHWRFVLAALIHASGVHLLVNAMALHNLGGEVERVLGRRTLLASLAAGALAGSYASARFEAAWAVGASGAVLGLAGTLATGARGPMIPSAVAWALRRRIATMAILIIGLGILWNRTYGGAVGLFIGNAAHAGGFAGGLVLGLLLPAPGAEPRLARAALGSLACLVPTLAALGLGVQGARAVAASRERPAPRDLAAEETWRATLERELRVLRTMLATGGPLRPVGIAALEVRLGVPEAWVELERTETRAVFGPAPGSPLLQLFAAPLGAPGNTADEIVAQTEAGESGLAEVYVAPFERGAVSGRRAVRLEMQYRGPAGVTQQVRFLIRRESSVLHVVFLGPPPLAAEAAARVLPTLTLTDPDAR